MNPQEILELKLLGKFISRFSIGDTFNLYFNDFWLVSQQVIFYDEDLFNKLIFENYKPSNFAIDKEYISKSALLAINMRKEITEIKIDELCNLIIKFENGNCLLIPTDEPIMDWQWCINKTGTDPYLEYEIACFWKGELDVL